MPTAPRFRRLKREIVARDPGTSIRIEEDVRPILQFLWHHHAELELSLISGKGMRHVGKSVEAFPEWDLTLIGSGLPHALSGRIEDGPFACIVVKFPRELLTASTLPEFAALGPLLADSARGLAMGAASKAVARRLLPGLAAEPSPIVRLARLLEVLAAMVADPERQLLSSPSRDQRAHPGIERVLARLHSRWSEQHSAEELAALASMTPESFSRAFHREVGRTAVTYIAELRVGNSCSLLAESEDRIIDIAINCGFSDLSNFNRWFQRVTGTTPSGYRELCRASFSLNETRPSTAFVDE